MSTARRDRPAGHTPMLLVAGATAFGCWLRVTDLAATPPEMTSDHIEKLLDAWRVHEGNHAVFFAGNGGREALQMYVVAWLAGPLGLGFTFDTLKWATIAEGVVTVPALAWMARQIIGTERAEDRQLGAWVGAAMAWLVAVSSWHVMLSRLGLRIVLTPLATALAIGAAARAARSRRLVPALTLGAVLGAGIYAYQANRLLPVAVLAPLVLARRWRTVALAVLVAMLVATPMFRYSRAHPEAFWSRTEGRLYGDGAFVRAAQDGTSVVYVPSWRERVSRLWGRREVLAQNYRSALAMYHHRGDAAWINNAGSRPALDPVTGALVIAGVVTWGAWLVRRREAPWWLPTLSVAVMLLPSALALAYPIENPSFTRASGTLPGVFFLAALPLGWVLWRIGGAGATDRDARWRPVVAALVLAGVVSAIYPPNRDNYFTDYRLSYQRHWRPYVEIARPIRAFVESGGALGNAFVVAYPHWLDHRILGARAGDLLWPNGLATRADLPAAIARNAGTPYALDPALPVFVMFHPADEDTAEYLRQHFAGGEIREIRYRWPDGSDDGIGAVRVFTAPAGSMRETRP